MDLFDNDSQTNTFPIHIPWISLRECIVINGDLFPVPVGVGHGEQILQFPSKEFHLHGEIKDT